MPGKYRRNRRCHVDLLCEFHPSVYVQCVYGTYVQYAVYIHLFLLRSCCICLCYGHTFHLLFVTVCCPACLLLVCTCSVGSSCTNFMFHVLHRMPLIWSQHCTRYSASLKLHDSYSWGYVYV